MIKYINLFLFLSLTTYATFATEETAGAINANTLQGLTSSAFATTNELETLKVTIVTGLSEYNVNISEEIYQLGKYWWMISAENNNEEIFHSESRFFYVSDIIDADGDEYNDMEELASGSDPNDPSDIPLIIISNPVCTNAYYGQQYYNPLKVNDNRKRVFWISQGMLPSGIILSREGVLFGIPKGTGSFLFDIEAFNEAGKRDVKRFYTTIKTPVQSCRQSGAGGYIDEEEE